jgi:radical SAM superfamily enzyme YgiQ (UPF0313 family)
MKHIVIFFPKLDESHQYHYMPISALCVASVLLSRGDSVRIHDQRIDAPQAFKRLLEWADEIIFTAYTGLQLSEAYRMALKYRDKADELNVRLVLGGPHANAKPTECARNGLFDRIDVGYAERGEHPMPWDLVDVKKYVNPKTERFMYVSSYGCPGHCTFCATKQRNPWVLLPIDKVERDIDFLMALYPFKECVMFDATVFTDKRRAKDINRIMRKHELEWVADARSCELIGVPPEFFKEFKGLKQLTIGLESGSQKVILNMEKGLNHLKIFESVARMMAQTNIKMVSGVVLGTPGETPDDLIATIKYIRHIKSINPNFYISSTFFRPLPNTKMSDYAKAYGYREPNSLASWAELGAENHYEYNHFMDAPWIYDIERYKAIYDAFRKECDYMFV